MEKKNCSYSLINFTKKKICYHTKYKLPEGTLWVLCIETKNHAWHIVLKSSFFFFFFNWHITSLIGKLLSFRFTYFYILIQNAFWFKNLGMLCAHLSWYVDHPLEIIDYKQCPRCAWDKFFKHWIIFINNIHDHKQYIDAVEWLVEGNERIWKKL